MKHKSLLLLALCVMFFSFVSAQAQNQITIRLDPYSVDYWANAYLYIWTGDNYYEYDYNTALVVNQPMTIAEDGWWTSSFDVVEGTTFRVGFHYDAGENYPEYYTSDYYLESTCFEINNYSLQATNYKRLTPDESTTFSVYVATAGTFGQVMVQTLGELTWTDVYALNITGSLNEDDLNFFQRMTNLQQLDLSGTDITSIGGCKELYKLTKVVLPATCTTISDYAFYGCHRLSIINLDHIQSVGEYAFYSVLNLEELNMPIVQTIGQYAFCYNTNLASIAMPLVISIDEYAFYRCESLAQVDLSNVTSLGNSAFAYCTNLESIALSDELETIPDNCFSGCYKLTSITLPASLTTIGSYALPCITDVQLPVGVQTVGSDNFTSATSITIPAKVTSWNSYSESWTDVYCHVVVPQSWTVFNNNSLESATLYVPAISLAAYKLHDTWYKFGKIIPMDGDVDDLTLNGDFTLLTTNGVANNVSITINSYGSLTTSTENTLTAGNYTQMISSGNKSYSSDYNSDGNVYYSYLPYTGMLLANSAITADNVTVKLVPRSERWNFFSLPFDVNMSDITIATEGTGTVGTSQWVIREYSGANRASNNGATWNNVPANGILQAHKGYILYWVVENSSEYRNNYDYYNDNLLYYFNMPAVNTANKQNIFATGDVNVPLTEYSAEFPQNRSWNLVGNPYPCSFDIQYMDFEAPITAWNGNGYVAYTTTDDNYTLRPAEAFFVQAPQGVTQITFHKEGRSAANKQEVTYEEYNNYDYYSPKRTRSNNVSRKVYNFTLSNGDYSDRARLVLNPQASAEYEMTRDAAKMMSSDNTVPQLFVNNNGLRYAIDERPEQTSYTLGAYFGSNGEYTLHLNVPQIDNRQILLTDTETQITTDISSGDYTFTTDAGTYDSRFIVTFLSRMPSSINDLNQPYMGGMKFIGNGQMFIIKNGVKYNLQGQMIK